MSDATHHMTDFSADWSSATGRRAGVARSVLGVGAVVLLAALAASPWFFGGVQAWFQVWLFAAVLFAALSCLACRWTSCDSLGRFPLAVVPLVLGVGLAALQLFPLSPSLLARVSPAAEKLRESLASEKNPADAALVDTLGLSTAEVDRPMSLYPASTHRDLALLVLATAAFAVGGVMFARGCGANWLLAVLAVNGGAVAFFGIVERLASNGKIYWLVPLTYPSAPFGPFVNRNNAGGFLLLCLAAALAMTVWAFRRDDELDGFADDAAFAERGSWWSRRKGATQRFFSSLDGSRLGALSLAICIVAGVFCSLSRGAVLAMIVAAVVTASAMCLARRRDWIPFRIVAVALVAAMGLVAWAGLDHAVRMQMATLLDLDAASKPLMSHWSESVRAVPDFWHAGSGLGTYRFLYGWYQETVNGSWFYFAENMYLETLVEAGIVGLSLLISSLVLVAAASWWLLRHATDAGSLAIGVAGIFAVSAQAVAAAFDFGLHIPANVLTLAVLAGCVAGRAATLRHEEPVGSPGIFRRAWPSLVLAAVVAGLVWGGLHTRRVAAVEIAMKRIDRLGVEGFQSPEKVTQVREGLRQALQNGPDDAQARLCLAHMDIQLYRLIVLDRYCRQVPADVDRIALWKATLPTTMHARIQQYAAAGDRAATERIRSEPAIVDHLLPALKQLVISRRSCPLLAEVHLLIAKLGVLASEPAAGGIHVARAAQVAPADPSVAFETGLLAFQAGRTDDALAQWRKCLALDPARTAGIVRCLERGDMLAERLERVLPDSPELLVQLAQDTQVTGAYPDLRSQLLERAWKLLQQGDYAEGQRRHLQGTIALLRGEEAAAIDDYRRAAELCPTDIAWRYELAQLLRRGNRLAEARRHAAYCVYMEPTRREYQALLEDINRTQIVTGIDSTELRDAATDAPK